MKEFIKIHKESVIFYLFVLIFLSMFTVIYNTIDMDYWARILQGTAFWELGHILYKDPFSFTETHLWLDHEWGAGIIFAAVQNLFGFYGILILRTLITFLIFLFIFKTINLKYENRNKFTDIAYLAASAFALTTITQSCLRCHFFTFLFFTVFLYILEKVRKQDCSKLLIILPVIMLFWCNIHGGCVSGLGLIGMYIIGELFNKKAVKKYIYTLIACLAVLFINPYGIDYVNFIFMATTMARPMVTEWISPFSHSGLHFMPIFKILFIINILILFLSVKKIKSDYTKYIVLAVCAYLSFKYVKNTPFFIIASMIFLYNEIAAFINKFLPEKLKNMSIKTSILLYFSVLLILFSFGLRHFSPDILSQQPVKVVNFMKINGLKGRIITPFDMGSYISYKMFPDILIYMDGRYEEVYYKATKDLLDDFYNVRNDGYKILDTGAEYVIVPADALLDDYMSSLDSYKLIYSDSENKLYAINSVLKDKYTNIADEYDYYNPSVFRINFDFRDKELTDYAGNKIYFE